MNPVSAFVHQQAAASGSSNPQQSTSPNVINSRFFSKIADTDMNGPAMRESEVLVLGELPCSSHAGLLGPLNDLQSAALQPVICESAQT